MADALDDVPADLRPHVRSLTVPRRHYDLLMATATVSPTNVFGVPVYVSEALPDDRIVVATPTGVRVFAIGGGRG